MTFWMVIRTDQAKESFVAGQIQQRGFNAWVPSEQRFVRRCRNAKARELVEAPLLPKRLFAAVPAALQANLRGIRHLVAIERDGLLAPLQIPNWQVVDFRGEVDRVNALMLALAARPTKRDKARWRSLKDGLEDMISGAKAAVEG